MRCFHLRFTILLALSGPFLSLAMSAPKTPAVTESQSMGCARLDFSVEGREALLIVPAHPAPGRPWIWRTEWFGAFPQADLALVARGWHVGYMNVKDMYGNPRSMALLDAYYRHVTREYQLSPKVVLEGVSRGGIYATNFAAQWPERVAALYLDAPVLDLMSWPGPKRPLWAECLASYGMTAEQLAAAKVNAWDRMGQLLQAHIPIFGVAGDADESVTYEENLAKFVKLYRAAGGTIEVVIKRGGKHHPHSLEDPTPIVEFLVKHSRE